MSYKIHIIGSIGSGKTTLAKMISEQLNVPHFELDNVVWIRLASGDKKRTDYDRDLYLQEIVNTQSWIIEGVHHKWISKSLEEADQIIFLDISLLKRRWRIIHRFIKQKFGVEKANYKPSLKTLKFLYNYNTVFEHKSKPEILSVLSDYKNKVVFIKNDQDIKHYLNHLT